MKKKIIYSVFATILLILIYIMIFNFSAADGDNSSAVSQKFTRWILELFPFLQGKTGNTTDLATAVDDSEGFVRKLAHFLEYGLVGFLSYSVVVLWIKKHWAGISLVLLQLMLSASLDEIHQLFVPGRYGCVSDVVIDFIGGCTGILIISLYTHFHSKIK